jgi:hypothetical protein
MNVLKTGRSHAGQRLLGFVDSIDDVFLRGGKALVKMFSREFQV